jgi:N-methylhydantoinase B
MKAGQDGASPTATVAAADPITTEVIRHGLVAVAEQMKQTIRRSAMNPIVYEVLDFSCALYDAEVRLLAQSETLPLFSGSMNFCIESAITRLGEDDPFEPGDVVVSTYGYDIGTHQQDLSIITPVFDDDELLIGYAVAKAHHMDIGGKDPYCTDTTDIFQEGLILPSVKLRRRGEPQRDIHRILVANSRLPDSLAGDLSAQVSASEVGRTGLLRVVSRNGKDVFDACVERIFDHGEALVRSFLAGIPDGRFTAAGAMDNDGISEDLIPLEVAVEVDGDGVVIDLTETPKQRIGPTNCPRAASVAAGRIAVLALASRREAVNEGHLRPIEVKTTPGTMYDPIPPAPIFMYTWPCMAAIDLIHRAFAEAVPTEVPAGSGGDILSTVIWGNRPNGDFWASGTDELIGQGATHGADGPSSLMHISCSGVRNTPIEIWESRAPILVERHDCVPDSAGPGRHRGGAGLEIYYRMLEPCNYTVAWERTRTAPWGLFGGQDGLPNEFIVRNPDGSTETITKVTNKHAPAGTVFELRSGAGGGYGPAAERDPAAVHADIKAGYVTEAAARRDYPHAFTAESAGPRPEAG